MRCPVCRRRISPTSHLNIYRHNDKVGRRCPTSGYPIRIAKELL